MMAAKRYVAVVGCSNYFGSEVLRVGQVVKLVKDPDNIYDAEAIKVELEPSARWVMWRTASIPYLRGAGVPATSTTPSTGAWTG